MKEFQLQEYLNQEIPSDRLYISFKNANNNQIKLYYKSSEKIKVKNEQKQLPLFYEIKDDGFYKQNRLFKRHKRGYGELKSQPESYIDFQKAESLEKLFFGNIDESIYYFKGKNCVARGIPAGGKSYSFSKCKVTDKITEVSNQKISNSLLQPISEVCSSVHGNNQISISQVLCLKSSLNKINQIAIISSQNSPSL